MTQRKMVRGLLIVMLNGWLVLPGCGRDKTTISAKEVSALPATPESSNRAKVTESYGKLPLSFEANEGQFDSRVKFVSRGGGHTVFLSSTEAVLSLYAPVKKARDRESNAISTDSWDPRADREAAGRSVLRMKLIGAAQPREIVGIDELPGSSNYLIGDDPSKWRTGIKGYSKVRYRFVYPGIDLVFHSDQRKLEYDFKVAPGANPGTIRVAFEGAKRVRIEKNGDLVFDTSTGEVRQHKPIAYQEVRGSRRLIAVRYVMGRNRQVGFEIGRYDRRRLLVIDPVLHYSTYLGGGGLDTANSVAVDANGCAYVVGRTTSTNFPIANGFQGAIAGTSDVFITKLNPAGDALVYSTYLGGSGQDSGFGVALDAEGNAYVTGETSSVNFPTKAPVQEALAGSVDAFVTKLNSEGSTLVYSSYLGGGWDDSGRAIAVDSAGAAQIAGNTSSPDFPLANPLQPTIGRTDGFVTKFNPGGTALVYSTFLGGSGNDSAAAIALDSSGNAYVTGRTGSSDFPTANAMQPANGDKNMFKSTDSGASWVAINNGVPGSAFVQALAIDPLNPSTVYAGTGADGTYKSSDAGGHWMQGNQGLPDVPVLLDLAIHPLTPSVVYAGAWESGVYKTTNGGASWDSILGEFFNTCLAIDPASPSTLYVGNHSLGVLVTTDAGATWENTDFPHAVARVSCLAIDPTHPGSVYVGTETLGIHRYPATCASIPLSSGSVRCVTVSASSPSTVYIGTGGGGVYKSANSGVSWTPVNSGFTESNVSAIAVDPINPLTVYAATSRNLYKSTDGGGVWNRLTVNSQCPTIAINEITIDPMNTSTLYAAATGLGEAYVTKLNSTGSAFVYSTYLGGSGGESGTGIAVDSAGVVYIAGSTDSLDIPSADSARPFAGVADAMVARITSDGTAFASFTFLGGGLSDAARSISIDSRGSVWITGDTRSSDFPTTPDAIPSGVPCASGSCIQTFVSRLDATGSFLGYSTYLGGAATPGAGGMGFAVAVDRSGSAYVVGQTFAADFPTTPGAFQIAYGGGSSDGFVAKIGSPCAYSLSRTSQAFPTTGGSASVDITSAIGCAWTAVSNDSWILVTSAENGGGADAVTFEVRENFEERFRIGTLSIAGQTFTVLQEGLASAGCSILISPTFSSFPAIGGSGSVNVLADEGCIWSASTDTSWVSITSNDNGIGFGVVTYSVGANPGAVARKGKILLAGQTFTIKQKGNPSSAGLGGNH